MDLIGPLEGSVVLIISLRLWLGLLLDYGVGVLGLFRLLSSVLGLWIDGRSRFLFF